MPDNTIRLYVVEQGASSVCVTEEHARVIDIKPEELPSMFGGKGEWVTVELESPTHGRQQEIIRRTMVPDPEVGFRSDLTRLPAARAAVMVKTWPDAWGKPSSENFEALSPTIANAINEAIYAYMYPSVALNEDFSAAWRLRRQSSGPKAESPS